MVQRQKTQIAQQQNKKQNRTCSDAAVAIQKLSLELLEQRVCRRVLYKRRGNT